MIVFLNTLYGHIYGKCFFDEEKIIYGAVICSLISNILDKLIKFLVYLHMILNIMCQCTEVL
jgi:hypothetical protein